MKCSHCGKDMEFIGSVALQDDYSAVEDLCFNIVERFKCDACQITSEFMKTLNSRDDSGETSRSEPKDVKTSSGVKLLNKNNSKK